VVGLGMILLVVEEHSRRTGYTPTPEGLAREMAYVRRRVAAGVRSVLRRN
jgi:hypothetical protein